MLEVIKLHKSFKKKEVLKNVSLEFKNGIYGLLGPNGAGKTTLIRCMVNLYDLNSGSIEYCGSSINGNNDLLSNIGYLPQKFGLFKELTVYENLKYFCILKKIYKSRMDDEIKNCLISVNLEDRISHKVSSLSGGMIRRLGIAQAILGHPKIIIFDEPTAGLDPEERIRFKNIVAQINKDRIIIISTHIVEDVEASCNKIIIMNEGRVLKYGSSEEIKSEANGKVYEVEKNLNADEYWYVEKSFSRNEKTFMRILSNKKENLKSLEPTIEDGYMCIVKGI
ncbi:ATP-binding cassette domain-containing protein [Sedimentibacter hydroxybenzoicus DSM 7310]|uniref:ATP-binding cassette domain-containing protein n=1 Tax=Sedimentibacter hydroxybenzoicus DSM 7310 TaxID=1123245 RepID=A0A974GXY6_SEDHY|nr:ATP-binding cassette domain-containing protein [Sedimentibacter hydroxybenzoicus]NYB75550.1 ATP-binding cassette domain-containing protein [Sedimentibacter hydroxybenzoicus DSM 7310]